MDPVPLHHALTLIRERSTPLLCLPRQASSDAIAGGLGLYLTLGKLGKRAKVVSPGFVLPPSHGFLPKSEEILTDVSALKKFIITVDTSRAPLEELSYDVVGKNVHIYLTPKGGFFQAKDVTISAGSFTYDLIITLDAPSLESFGKLFEENREFFYHTPIINLDHRPANERYGHVVLVDVTATSTSEIIFELLEASKQPLLDETIATALLTGMISKTRSFQTPTVTPRSLAIASHLISSGARRDEIIRNLYRTKRLAVLKLWGRALTRLQSAQGQRLVWTNVSQQDLTESGASLQDVPGVIDELIANTAGAEVMFVLAERQGEGHVFAATSQRYDALALFRSYHPEGTRHFVSFVVRGRPVSEVLKDLPAELQRQLAA